MRTAPSTADLDLLRKLREEHGVEVSATQLERWRSRGLLPRVRVVRERFGGSTVPPHSDQVVRAAALLGTISRRGRAWQLDAERLFNEWHSLTQEALRETAAYLVRIESAKMRDAWERAKKKAEPADDPDEEAAEIGQRAVESLPYLRRAVRKEVELAHHDRGVNKEELEDYTWGASTWRMVDLVEPARLDESHRNLARHGVEEPMRPLWGNGAYPLPSERLVVAQSLTWTEAELYRHFARQRITENPALGRKEFGLLSVTTWIVASERLKTPPHQLDQPLPQEQLDAATKLLPVHMRTPESPSSPQFSGLPASSTEE